MNVYKEKIRPFKMSRFLSTNIQIEVVEREK